MKGQAMTDTRQALEEAWDKIHPMPELSDIVSRDQFLMAMEVSWPARSRFRRFLDAEAWTDAAMMLVPEDTFPRLDFTMPQAILVRWGGRWEEVSRGGGLSMHEAILEAIAQAALRAKEAGDV